MLVVIIQWMKPRAGSLRNGLETALCHQLGTYKNKCGNLFLTQEKNQADKTFFTFKK